MNKNLVKWVVIFGGGLLGFMLLKPKKKDLELAQQVSSTDSATESFDSNDSKVKPSKENAEIVYKAYSSAIQAGEPSSALEELNKECMKDYSMRCYMDKDGKYIVCDASGEVIITK